VVCGRDVESGLYDACVVFGYVYARHGFYGNKKVTRYSVFESYICKFGRIRNICWFQNSNRYWETIALVNS
jgi:hypothetical protein